MKIEEEVLYLDQRIEVEQIDTLKDNINDVEKIVVQTNDIHPAVMQLLFCVTQEKEVVVEDQFNERFFKNLHIQAS